MQKCEKCKSEYLETSDMIWVTIDDTLILICKHCNKKRVSQVNKQPN